MPLTVPLITGRINRHFNHQLPVTGHVVLAERAQLDEPLDPLDAVGLDDVGEAGALERGGGVGAVFAAGDGLGDQGQGVGPGRRQDLEDDDALERPLEVVVVLAGEERPPDREVGVAAGTDAVRVHETGQLVAPVKLRAFE